MADSRKSKNPPSRVRRAFRWSRIAILILATSIVGLFLWSNLIGVPGFVGAELKGQLLLRSIDLDFTRLRLRGFSHLVAEDVRIAPANSTNAPSFSVREAEFLVDYSRLLKGDFKLSGLQLVSGTLLLPADLSENRALAVTNIHANIELLPGDTVRVADLSAETLGARARLSGELKHLSRFNFASGDKKEGPPWQTHVRDVLDVAEQLHFKDQPEIAISIDADGADIPGTRAAVTIRSGEVSSRWGTFDRLEISSAIAPSASNNAVRGNFFSEIAGFKSQVGLIDSLRIEGETLWDRDMELLLTNRVNLIAGALDSRWFRSSGALAMLASFQQKTNGPIRSQVTVKTGTFESSGVRTGTNALSATLDHPLPFPSPAVWLGRLFAANQSSVPSHVPDNTISGQWIIDAADVTATEMALDNVRVRGSLLTSTNRVSDPNLAFWRFLAPMQAPWELVVTNIRSGEIAIGALKAAGKWQFPNLSLATMDAQLHGGFLKASGHLDVSTRQAAASAQAKFPYERVSDLLEKPAQRWLAQFTWQDPPAVQADFRVTFPPWTGTTNSFNRAVLPSLYIAGDFEGGGTFRGIPADHATSSFVFSNLVWRLPDLLVTRPEGQARLDYMGDIAKADFYCKIDSGIDPAIIRVLFPEEQQEAFSIVKFAQPPLIRAEAWGNWLDDSRLGVTGSIAATNFFVREQSFTDIRADIVITNSLIHCSNVAAHRGKEEARATHLLIDLPGGTMFVTNIVSTIDPYIAMSLVGDEAYDAINPYRFAVTPTVRVNGIVPLRHWSKADLRFEVAGNEFSFWKFRLPTLVGEVHWRSNNIMFSNVTANFYGGKARWSGHFVVDPRRGEDHANFSFYGQTTNTELKTLVADLTGRTNHMEGTLHGELVITSASTKNDRTWNGYGNAVMEDGFLWNVPIFGVFSPILDGIAPGLGSSRVSSGSGTFNITNSVVHTRDMQVRATAFRLGYKGQVDLDGNLDATVEALILRDAWVVGRLFSLALWPLSKAFEARVTGTLNSPNTDLRYVPNFLLAPFRALNTLANPGQSKSPPPSHSPLPGQSSVPPPR